MSAVFRRFSLLVAFLLLPTFATAQSVWIQIEARPTQAEAEARAQDWAGGLTDVNGFALGTGWYGIALGPFDAAEAPAVLARLRAEGRIPRDSFVADGGNFAGQFWPVAGLRTPAPAMPAPQAQPETPAAQPAPVDETPAEARASEALLDRAQREALQTALQWEGFYNSAIDGAFGRGTRAAMADWQAAKGYELTGVLTTRQRAEALAGYQQVLASLGFQTVTDTTAGIAIDLPLGLMGFDGYQPPFAHFTPAEDGGPRAFLISQQGDMDDFRGLYDILQTLDLVPLDGPRRLSRTTFSIEGRNGTVETSIQAEISGDRIKGFGLVWPAGDSRRRALALGTMTASFRNLDGVLPDVYGADATQNVDLLSGLEIRRPDTAGTGFFVDEAGHVLTSAATVASCTRITIADDYPMTASAISGDLALLSPETSIAPPAIARFQTGTPRLASEVAIAGYSYGGRLGGPSLAYGQLADLRAPDGREDVLRLALAALPGDAGGPVYDASGAVLGMVLPREDGARRLPEDVNLAAGIDAIVRFLSDAGITPVAGTGDAPRAPEDLIRDADAMTVLVSCWN